MGQVQTTQPHGVVCGCGCAYHSHKLACHHASGRFKLTLPLCLGLYSGYISVAFAQSLALMPNCDIVLGWVDQDGVAMIGTYFTSSNDLDASNQVRRMDPGLQPSHDLPARVHVSLAASAQAK